MVMTYLAVKVHQATKITMPMEHDQDSQGRSVRRILLGRPELEGVAEAMRRETKLDLSLTGHCVANWRPKSDEKV